MSKKLFPFSGRFMASISALALGVIFALGSPPSAQAALQGTTGNAIIRNTATIAYNDANSNVQTPVTASLDVTVNTVAAAPTVLAFSPSPGSTDGTGVQQAYSVTIRTNSNGPGAISFATADGTLTNIAAGTVPTTPGNIFLGSTIIDPTNSNSTQTVANAATITLAIPNDGGIPSDTAVTGGSIGDGVVNGLKNTDTVYLTDGTLYYGPFTVTTVTDNAVGGGTTAAPDSVVLTNNSGSAIGPFTTAAGWMIVENKNVTVTVTQGDITNKTLAASWVTTVTATMGGNSSNNTVTTNAHGGHISIAKYVRNTLDTAGTGTSVTYNTHTYYPTGVSGKPTDTLEYLLVITNDGLGLAKSVTATDPVPTYTHYVANSTRLNLITVVGDGATSPMIAGLRIDADLARDPTPLIATGDLATTAVAHVTYQVTVD